MDKTEIKKVVNELRELSLTSDPFGLREKYKEFYELYPRLFEVSMTPSFKLDYLDMMLDTMQRIKDNSTTQDAADEIVYSTLKEKYVDPVVANIDPKK